MSKYKLESDEDDDDVSYFKASDTDCKEANELVKSKSCGMCLDRAEITVKSICRLTLT